MKVFVECDWRTVKGLRFPVVAIILGIKKFVAHDGADGRAVCEFEYGDLPEDRLAESGCRIVDQSAILAPVEAPVKPGEPRYDSCCDP